jgi:hypothetical protein
MIPSGQGENYAGVRLSKWKGRRLSARRQPPPRRALIDLKNHAIRSLNTIYLVKTLTEHGHEFPPHERRCADDCNNRFEAVKRARYRRAETRKPVIASADRGGGGSERRGKLFR